MIFKIVTVHESRSINHTRISRNKILDNAVGTYIIYYINTNIVIYYYTFYSTEFPRIMTAHSIIHLYVGYVCGNYNIRCLYLVCNFKMKVPSIYILCIIAIRDSILKISSRVINRPILCLFYMIYL